MCVFHIVLSVNSIIRLVFVMGTLSVFCATVTGFLNIYTNFTLQMINTVTIYARKRGVTQVTHRLHIWQTLGTTHSLIGKQQGVGRPAISRSVGHRMDENEAAISWPTSSAVAIHRNRRLLLIRNTCYNALRKLISTTVRIKRYMLISFIHFFLLSFLIIFLPMFFFSLSHLLSSFTEQVGSCCNACNVCSGAARLNLG
jgi:hypothetical protein